MFKKGYKHTEEVKRKIRESMKGDKHPMFGKHHTKKTKIKISESLKGVKLSKEHREAISEGLKGNKLSKKHKEKISKALKGKVLSKKHRMNISKNHVGMKGHKHSKEVRKILSKANKGENNPMFGKIHSKQTRRKMSRSIKKSWKNIPIEKRITRTRNAIMASQKANPSLIEKMIWKELNNFNIKYKTQVSFNHNRFIVDIHILDRNLIIECNGNYYHDYKRFPKKKIRDEALQKYCDENSYKLIWLWEDEIRENPELALKNSLGGIS